MTGSVRDASLPPNVNALTYATACRRTTAPQVVVYDSLEYCASLRNLDAVRDAPNFAFVKGDIRSADLVRHVLKTHEIDTIMHFAAQTHVDNSFGNSIDFTVRLVGVLRNASQATK